jgi:hypothetical protein
MPAPTPDALVLRLWTHHRKALVASAIGIMGIAAAVWLGFGGWRLAVQVDPLAAVDLLLRQTEVRGAFMGEDLYENYPSAVYPPASYVIMWPLLGWCEPAVARWLWLVTSALTLGWLMALLIRESPARTPGEKIFIGLLPLCTYAAGTTLGNGQLILHALPCLLSGTLLLTRGKISLGRDVLGAILIVLALVKPSVAAPFVWIVLFVPGRLRPISLVVGIYLLLTLVGVHAIGGGFMHVVGGWIRCGGDGALYGSEHGGVLNLHTLITDMEWDEWALPSSIAFLILIGWWVRRHRHADVWVLMGACAFLARIWTYHRWYDDLMLVLAQIALLKQLVKREQGGQSAQNSPWASLLVLMVISLLAPGGRHLVPEHWLGTWENTQGVLWLFTLWHLARQAK